MKIEVVKILTAAGSSLANYVCDEDDAPETRNCFPYAQPRQSMTVMFVSYSKIKIMHVF